MVKAPRSRTSILSSRTFCPLLPILSSPSNTTYCNTDLVAWWARFYRYLLSSYRIRQEKKMKKILDLQGFSLLLSSLC